MGRLARSRMSATRGLGALLVAAVLGQARRASAFGPPPPPPIPVSCYVTPGTDYKYAPGNVFPDTPGHEHGRVYTDSAADCCALCQSLKNCSFYTFNNDGQDATPTCYGTPGPCCYLKTAAAAGGSTFNPISTSGGKGLLLDGLVATSTNHTFTAVPGKLTSGCGIDHPYGCDVAPKQNVTLASAEKICAALDACVGFSFQAPPGPPAGVVQDVYFKREDPDCSYSRFAPDVCPYEGDGTWQTYLKDYKPVPRTPVWLRHYNLSVVPPRCGDINIEPLFPYDIDDSYIRRYAAITIEEFSSFVLELGECGKVGPNGDPRALAYTKRSNPASSGTPWLGPGGGAGGGPGDPGYPGTGGSLRELCYDECSCYTSGDATPCTDANCIGRCVACSPSFNKRLASNSTLVRLWCDPADPACKNGEPTRAPKNVRVLADFAEGSPTNVKWTDHNSIPPTSNLTIIHPKAQGGDSYAEFVGTVYANAGYTRIATSIPAFKKVDLSEYAGQGAIVVEARYPKAHHCYLNPYGGGSLCHFEGFKLSLTSLKAPHHHGGRELFGMYKADLGKAKSTQPGPGWTILRLPLTAFSSDWSDFTGECNTKDPDGYQHKCCDASSGVPYEEPCPTSTGLASIVGLSMWAEGVLGDFSFDIKSISIEI